MHWCYTANPIKLVGSLDATAFYPLMAVLIFPFKATIFFQILFWAAIAMVLVLLIVARFGISPTAAFYLARALIGQWIANGVRPIDSR